MEMSNAEIYEIAKANPLFRDITFCGFEHMLKCLSAKTKALKKDEVILRFGESPENVGLLIEGCIRFIREDKHGYDSIINEFAVPDLIGEVYACAGLTVSPVTVISAVDSVVLLFNYKRAVTTCSSACQYHTKFIENMLVVLARKNLLLHQKYDIICKRTTREKLLGFFDLQRGASKKFTVNLNREEMARFLCVDRSAMSNELSKMQNEGIIKYYRSNFEII